MLGTQLIRDGGHHLQVDNSGLEVWLYDDANREAIRKFADSGYGAMPGNFEALTQQGLVVGYSLIQDDPLDVAVHVGKPFTAQELAIARWLEPQTAFLRLPSGALCIESNDASRIGPGEPGEEGGRVALPAGDYRLTLYRVDHEALQREGIEWNGPQEIILLTPGGSPGDAATGLLPFEERRDVEWVGKYTIDGNRAEALVWFGDDWDTFVLNLDRAAAVKIGLVPGSYLRIHIPSAGITVFSAFSESWEAAKRLPLPAFADRDEYGYASFIEMSEWDGAEALFCRRDTSKKKIEDAQQTLWLPATVEVLAAVATADVPPPGAMVSADVRRIQYFDANFLAMVLSDVLPEVDDEDELEWSAAVDMLDRKFAKAGLAAMGDVMWERRTGPRSMEMCARLYAGLPDTFACVLVTDGCVEILLLSELENGTWIVTGLADDMEAWISTRGPDGLFVPNPRVRLQPMDESLAKIFSAHKTSVRRAKPAPAPNGLEPTLAAFQRFVASAFS